MDSPDPQGAMMEELLGSEVAGRLLGLQPAIDAFVEEGVAVCMASEGFEYVPRSMEVTRELRSGAGIAYFNVASSLLNSLEPTRETSARLNPNATHYSELSDDEQEAWDRTHADCRVEISAEHENPLASASGWFSEVFSDAASRTASEPAIVNAGVVARTCFQEGTGSESPPLLANSIGAEVEQLRAEQLLGELSDSDLIDALLPLAEQESALSIIYDECQAPLLAEQARVFSGHLLARMDENRAQAELWALGFADEIRPYEKYFLNNE